MGVLSRLSLGVLHGKITPCWKYPFRFSLFGGTRWRWVMLLFRTLIVLRLGVTDYLLVWDSAFFVVEVLFPTGLGLIAR